MNPGPKSPTREHTAPRITRPVDGWEPLASAPIILTNHDTTMIFLPLRRKVAGICPCAREKFATRVDAENNRAGRLGPTRQPYRSGPQIRQVQPIAQLRHRSPRSYQPSLHLVSATPPGRGNAARRGPKRGAPKNTQITPPDPLPVRYNVPIPEKPTSFHLTDFRMVPTRGDCVDTPDVSPQLWQGCVIFALF